jgi:hypothetical protein
MPPSNALNKPLVTAPGWGGSTGYAADLPEPRDRRIGRRHIEEDIDDAKQHREQERKRHNDALDREEQARRKAGKGQDEYEAKYCSQSHELYAPEL